MTDSRVVSRPGDPIRPTMFPTGGPLTLRKACQCSPSTASGPRLVPLRIQVIGGRVSWFYSLVRMACDVCNTPWKEA